MSRYAPKALVVLGVAFWVMFLCPRWQEQKASGTRGSGVQVNHGLGFRPWLTWSVTRTAKGARSVALDELRLLTLLWAFPVVAEAALWGRLWLLRKQGIVAPNAWHFYSPLCFLLAVAVDDRVPTYGDKDGYGPFTALATFALAQGAALTAVAKGEHRTGLVLTLYAVAVAVTVFWIWTMLRAVKAQAPVGGVGPVTDVRAYDRPTITYGRWAQSWTLLLALVLVYLGIQGLLPNQTTREPYNGGNLFLDSKGPDAVRELYYRGGKSWFDRFLKWDLDGKQLTWFEQREPFTAFYTPFRMTFVPSGQFTGDEFQVFLARREPGDPGFQLREVAYIGSEGGRTFDIVGADRDDFVVVIGYARYNAKAKPMAFDAAAELRLPGSSNP